MGALALVLPSTQPPRPGTAVHYLEGNSETTRDAADMMNAVHSPAETVRVPESAKHPDLPNSRLSMLGDERGVGSSTSAMQWMRV